MNSTLRELAPYGQVGFTQPMIHLIDNSLVGKVPYSPTLSHVSMAIKCARSFKVEIALSFVSHHDEKHDEGSYISQKAQRWDGSKEFPKETSAHRHICLTI